MGTEGSERPRSESVATLPGIAWRRALWASACGVCAVAVGQWVQSLQAAAACPPGCSTDTLAFDVWGWVAVASGAAAALVARGASGWVAMTAGALVSSAVLVFVTVYAATFDSKIMSSLGVTALVLVPATAGYLGLRGLRRLAQGQLGAALSQWRKTTWAIVIWTAAWAVVMAWWFWFSTSTYLSANVGVLLWLVGLVILAIPWFVGRRRSDRRVQ